MEEIQQEEKKHNGNDIFHIKEKIYEMILYGNPQLKDFPKTERYVLAGDIRESYFCGFATPYCKLQGKEITHNVY